MSANTESYPSVLSMAGPLVVSFWMRAAFTFVDTAYAATIGDAAVAAIGLVVPFEFIMIALWVGISTGLTSSLSRAMGAYESENIELYKRTTWTIILTVVPLFGLLGVGIWFAAPHLGLKPDIARAFQIYGTVLLAGSAVTGFWSIMPDSIVKAHQDTRSTMWAGICSNVINVTLNTLFLFVFHWGVFGIALSTVIGRIGGLVYALNRANEHEQRRMKEFEGKSSSAVDPNPFKTVLALAIPSSAGFVLIAGETGLINVVLGSLENSASALAAYSIYYRVSMFFINPIIAIGIALLPFTAKRFGARDREGLLRGLRDASLAAVAYCLFFVAPLLTALGPWLSQAFAESEQTAEFALLGIRVVPWACLAGCGFLICRPVFEGMQRGTPGLVMALTRYLVLTAPGVYLGIHLARQNQASDFQGLVLGLLSVGLISSVLFSGWLALAVARLEFPKDPEISDEISDEIGDEEAQAVGSEVEPGEGSEADAKKTNEAELKDKGDQKM